MFTVLSGEKTSLLHIDAGERLCQIMTFNLKLLTLPFLVFATLLEWLINSQKP